MWCRAWWRQHVIGRRKTMTSQTKTLGTKDYADGTSRCLECLSVLMLWRWRICLNLTIVFWRRSTNKAKCGTRDWAHRDKLSHRYNIGVIIYSLSPFYWMERSIVIIIMVMLAIFCIYAVHRSIFYFHSSVIKRIRLQLTFSLFGAFSPRHTYITDT